ncbi:hypothetical protein HNQ59_003997, partial [Chitinivorax tropicus]|nr:hypothetical protein [Chitinivorax tropicus]
HDPVLRNLQLQPWAEESLPILKHLQISPFIEKAFRKIPEIEAAPNKKSKAKSQLEHLLAIAEHEQGVVLQPLIYEQADFKRALATMRSWPIRWISPKQQIVFTNHCETDDPKLKSEAPEDMIVEDYRSRMGWIGKAADKFHGLMQESTAFMEIQLSAIADWALAKAREDEQ